MLRDIQIDGVSYRTDAYNIALHSGKMTMPERRGDNLVLPGSNGYRFMPNRPFAEGTGSLTVWAVGADPVTGLIGATISEQQALVQKHIAILQRVFTRPHRLVTIRAEQPDGTWRTADVEFTEWSSPEMQAGGTRATWEVAYNIPDVWWKDEANTSQSALGGPALPKTLDLSQFAGMTGIIDDGVIIVSGPITNPRVTDAETGAWVQYSGTVPDGEVWTLDSGAATSAVNGTSVVANTTHAGGYKLFTLPNVYANADTPRLVLSGVLGGNNTNLTFTGRRKWVTA